MKNRWWAGNWKANEWQIVGKRVANGWHGSKRLLNEWQSVGKWLVSELETGRQINGKWSRKGSGKWLLSRKGLYTKWMANSWNTSDKWLASGSQMSSMTVYFFDTSHLPSGKRLHSYWNWPFIVYSGFVPLKMVIFHSYVTNYQPFTNQGEQKPKSTGCNEMMISDFLRSNELSAE